MGNIFAHMGQDANATLAGVGGVFSNTPNQQNQQGQGLIWGAVFNPAHISRDMHWPVEVTFSTANDITEVRVRDAAWNFITPAINTFVEGTNNSRVWTVRNIWPTVAENANSATLIVEVRRGTGGWQSTPAITVPVW
jgi:hypothetical protein